jgi:sugar phosphate isomerase/epimerase
MVADAGLRVSRLDPLCTWAPAWRSWDLGPEYDITASMDSDLFLELSAFFGCRYLSLNAMWKPGFYTKPEMAGFYREICGKAAKFDIACDLEPLPMWGIQTIEDALEIIDLADVANPGLVFDVTHFVRGGSPISVVDEVPKGLIHTVQLCDGYQPARMTLEEECFNRLWPGTGDFDIASILEALDRNSGLNGVGPEVFSPAYAAGETTPAWIADRINESLARYPQLLADRGAGL